MESGAQLYAIHIQFITGVGSLSIGLAETLRLKTVRFAPEVHEIYHSPTLRVSFSWNSTQTDPRL